MASFRPNNPKGGLILTEAELLAHILAVEFTKGVLDVRRLHGTRTDPINESDFDEGYKLSYQLFYKIISRCITE